MTLDRQQAPRETSPLRPHLPTGRRGMHGCQTAHTGLRGCRHAWCCCCLRQVQTRGENECALFAWHGRLVLVLLVWQGSLCGSPIPAFITAWLRSQTVYIVEPLLKRRLCCSLLDSCHGRCMAKKLSIDLSRMYDVLDHKQLAHPWAAVWQLLSLQAQWLVTVCWWLVACVCNETYLAVQ